MHIDDIKELPEKCHEILKGIVKELRPAQEKALKNGLLHGNNLVVCTPTASGKTLIAELAILKTVLEHKGKAIYIVPLKALAFEKFNDFKKRYDKIMKIAMSVGDLDSSEPKLAEYDIIIVTSEKLDSLLRHKAYWINEVRLLVIDEIHLINDPGRGPTLEIIITLLRKILKNIQILGLSATIGNPKSLADWLDANLVEDSWRPVKLKKGIHMQSEIEFFD